MLPQTIVGYVLHHSFEAGEVMASHVPVLNKLFKRKSGADFHKQ